MKKPGLLLCLLAIALSGAYLLGKSTNDTTPLKDTQKAATYPLLAQRILIDNPNDTIVNFTPLRQKLNEYFTDNDITGGVYFEYLPTGTSIRISDDSQEIAASLIKLPVAMELYRAKELGALKIDQVVSLKPEWLDSDYGMLYRKGAGFKLTLAEASRIMLVDSDNTALKAITYSLEGHLPKDQSVLSSLDIEYSQGEDLTLYINAKSYSSILKCLYFSCYLGRDDSQLILDTLTETHFDGRIAAGINDKTIKIAHKIGVAGQITQSDCGIVYMPKRNYILCAMLNGQDSATTDIHIADISKITYEYLKATP